MRILLKLAMNPDAKDVHRPAIRVETWIYYVLIISRQPENPAQVDAVKHINVALP